MYVQGDSACTREIMLASSDCEGADAIVHLEGKLSSEQARSLRPHGKLILLSDVVEAGEFTINFSQCYLFNAMTHYAIIS